MRAKLIFQLGLAVRVVSIVQLPLETVAKALANHGWVVSVRHRVRAQGKKFSRVWELRANFDRDRDRCAWGTCQRCWQQSNMSLDDSWHGLCRDRAEHNRREKQDQICALADEVDTGDGVVIVTDMFGGSPSNLALPACRDDRKILYGVNLPVLVKLAKSRHLPLEAAITASIDAGRKCPDSMDGK